jgi:hypothetical protein
MDNSIVCAPCRDSPLSVASNVIGLLTFAIATIATYLAYITLTLNVSDEIELHIQALDGLREELIPLLSFCDQASRGDSEAFRLHKKILETKLRALLVGAETLATNLRSLPQLDPNRLFRFQLRRRLRWLRVRQLFVVQLERIAAMKRDLMLTLLSLLTW